MRQPGKLPLGGNRRAAPRAGFLFAATLCIAAAAAPPPARRAPEAAIAIPGGHLQLVQRGDRTMITLRTHGSTTRLTLPQEDSIYASAAPLTTLVGALPGQVLILRSEYASNPSGGAYQCGAGTEVMLRVLALHPGVHQTFSQRLASCWTDIDEGALTWDQATSTLTIERTTADSSRQDAPVQDLRTHYHVAPDGTVTPGQVDHLPV